MAEHSSLNEVGRTDLMCLCVSYIYNLILEPTFEDNYAFENKAD